MIFEFDIGIGNLIIGLLLTTFWKRALHIYAYIHINIYIYCMTSLDRLIMGPTLNRSFREVIGLGRNNTITMVWVIVWDRNKAIDIEVSSICGGGRLDKLLLYIIS